MPLQHVVSCPANCICNWKRYTRGHRALSYIVLRVFLLFAERESSGNIDSPVEANVFFFFFCIEVPPEGVKVLYVPSWFFKNTSHSVTQRALSVAWQNFSIGS